MSDDKDNKHADLAEAVFALLDGFGLELQMYDETGTEATDPSLARNFFSIKPNVMVTIDKENDQVQFNKGSDLGASVDKIQKGIRRLAGKALINFNVQEHGKSIQPRDFSGKAKNMKKNPVMENANNLLAGKIMHILNGGTTSYVNVLMLQQHIGGATPRDIEDTLKSLEEKGEIQMVPGMSTGGGRYMFYKLPIAGADEARHYTGNPMRDLRESFSRMFGSAMTSQQVLENVRILIRHRTPVDETVRGSRSRNISAIFLECNGERFRFPHTYLPGARAMAQHMAHGGAMADKVGSHITESTGQLLKLQSFNRYVTTNKLINEDSSGIIETIKENIETLRTELRKLTGVKTYETVKARLETFEREPLAEDDTSQLKELFTIRRFDEKFEEVLPIVKQLVQEKDTFHKRIEESAASTVTLRREVINTTPMFEFASDNARLGFKLSEFSLRIMENDELAGFIGKIGTKLCKEGVVNDFERAVLKQVLENAKIQANTATKTEIKESADIEGFFNKFVLSFY